MELTVQLQSECPYCRAALAALKAEGIDERYYGVREKNTMKFHPGYTLRPDRNAAGIITHWHLDLGDR